MALILIKNKKMYIIVASLNFAKLPTPLNTVVGLCATLQVFFSKKTVKMSVSGLYANFS